MIKQRKAKVKIFIMLVLVFFCFISEIMLNEVTAKQEDFSLKSQKKQDLLKFKKVKIFTEKGKLVLKSENDNYYRATDVFGDVATKKEEFPDQKFIESRLNETTKETVGFVEKVVVKVKGFFNSETARDAKMADIFAKQIGTWTKDGEIVSGGFKLENTDAYRFALMMNADDYTLRETEYKGNIETHAYFDNSKSDNKIILFSNEIVDGKEYFAMYDKEGNIHYFDKSDNLREVPID